MPRAATGDGAAHARNAVISAGCWDDLPEPVAARIILLTLADSHRGLLEWLQLSSVCRAWRAVLRDSAVELVFPYWLTPAQRDWFRRSAVAVRGVRFAGPADQLCDPAAGDAIQALAAKQPSIVTALQAVYHVAPGPEAWPALARCTALAELSLVLPDPALADHFGTLPPSLTHLKASGVDTLEGGAHFGHLARLRTLELDSQVGGAGAAAFDAHLTGLPPSLRRLRLQIHSMEACLSVWSFPDPPSAALSVELRSLRIRILAPWQTGEQPGFRLSLDTASFAVQHEMPDRGEYGRNAIAAGLVNWIAEAPMRSVALSTWSEWSGGLRTSSLSVSVVDPARPHPWRDQTALFRHVTLVSCHRE